MSDERLLEEQVRYYRARAGEYDQWFLRVGRYDRGPDHRAAWFAEVATVEAALREARPRGDVLELACGTGLWTKRLVETADRVTAVDAAPEALSLNRDRLRSDRVEYVKADLFSWTPPRRFDFVFFGFWLSHVPADRFDAFWGMVRAALKPGGRAFFVDSALHPESGARDQSVDRSGVARRTLNDGRTFEVVKVFREPASLEAELEARGWRGAARGTGSFFVYGCVEPLEPINPSA